jgi:hypothetical protein
MSAYVTKFGPGKYLMDLSMMDRAEAAAARQAGDALMRAGAAKFIQYVYTDHVINSFPDIWASMSGDEFAALCSEMFRLGVMLGSPAHRKMMLRGEDLKLARKTEVAS